MLLRPRFGWALLIAMVTAHLPASAIGASFGIANANDSGPGSLRQAILDANATPGRDLIYPSAPLGGPVVVSSPLPVITDSVILSTHWAVSIDGSKLSADPSPALVLTGPDSLVAGLRISGFGGDGIVLRDTRNSSVVMSTIEGNSGSGIVVDGGSDNWIGGTSYRFCSVTCPPGSGNEIHKNGRAGILARSTRINIEGNNIGSWSPTSGNRSNGITLEGGSGNVVFDNWIGFNKGAGVCVLSGLTRIQGNLIQDNTGIGIDLGCDGPTSNSGPPANRRNYPILTNVRGNTYTVRVVGTLDSQPDRDYVIEIFRGENTCIAPGVFQSYKSLYVRTAATGKAFFDVLMPDGYWYTTPDRAAIVATATDRTEGATSEFSPCVPFQRIADKADIEVSHTVDSPVVSGSDVIVTIEAKNRGPIDIGRLSLSGHAAAGATIFSSEMLDDPSGHCWFASDCSVDLLPAGTSVRMRQRLRITAPPGSTVSHTAAVGPPEQFSKTSKPHSTTALSVVSGDPLQVVDLDVKLKISRLNDLPNTLWVTATVTNHGQTSAANVIVKIDVTGGKRGLLFDSRSGPSGCKSEASGSDRCVIQLLPAARSQEASVDVAEIAGNEVWVTVTVTSDEPDLNPADNRAVARGVTPVAVPLSPTFLVMLALTLGCVAIQTLS